MPLRRLLGFSPAVSGRLRRSLSTAAARPPWAMIHTVMPAVSSDSYSERPWEQVGATVELAEPPKDSHLFVPFHLINTSPRPDPDSGFVRMPAGQVCSTSSGGLVLLIYFDLHANGQQGASQETAIHIPEGIPRMTRFVCNPVSGQLFRLPDNCGPYKILPSGPTGILTQADRGRGQPDRYAVAMLGHGGMLRFLSETGEWELVETSPNPYQLPRPTTVDQEVLDFGGRLWWVDVSWGTVSADPFMDRPEPHFVELPRGSVLPAGTGALERGAVLAWLRKIAGYRRMGVSEGRLRYAEVSQGEPFVLSSFALDAVVALSWIWADGGYPWLPLQGDKTPQIVVLDPLNANVMYLSVGEHVVAVDMHKGEVIASSLQDGTGNCISCVLPPRLEWSRVPSAGKKNTGKNKTLADVLVRTARGLE